MRGLKLDKKREKTENDDENEKKREKNKNQTNANFLTQTNLTQIKQNIFTCVHLKRVNDEGQPVSLSHYISICLAGSVSAHKLDTFR